MGSCYDDHRVKHKVCSMTTFPCSVIKSLVFGGYHKLVTNGVILSQFKLSHSFVFALDNNIQNYSHSAVSPHKTLLRASPPDRVHAK